VILLRKIERRIPVAAEQEAAEPGLAKKFDALDEKLGRMLEIYEKFEKQAEEAQKQRQAAARPQQQEPAKQHEIPVGDSRIRGPKDAPITITSFVDFQCPYSARFQPVIDSVQEAYPKQVNYVLKHFPLNFHKAAKPAGRAVLAAGEQGKYWEMVDLILKNNRGLTEEKFEEFAKELGLNMKKFKKSYADKDGEWEKLIQADYDLGVKVGVRGTPTYYINGRQTRSRSLDAFKQEIDAILNKKDDKAEKK